MVQLSVSQQDTATGERVAIEAAWMIHGHPSAEGIEHTRVRGLHTAEKALWELVTTRTFHMVVG